MWNKNGQKRTVTFFGFRNFAITKLRVSIVRGEGLETGGPLTLRPLSRGAIKGAPQPVLRPSPLRLKTTQKLLP